jgi:predicted deacetylase
MAAKYLLRLDDACPTMDHKKWQTLENILDRFELKPVVAVVPDNLDPKLSIDAFDPMFWNRVRSWRDKGWTIAMHGYQHLMHHTECRQILPFYKRSEFSGLCYEAQAAKIKKSWELFLGHNIVPEVWIAPAHCFDLVTLKAIYNETTIRTISDGIACNPYYSHGFSWVPQQLWDFSERRSGVWTVCLHPNSMTDRDFSCLYENIASGYLGRVFDFKDVRVNRRRRGLIDYIYSVCFWQRRRLYKYLDLIRSKGVY